MECIDAREVRKLAKKNGKKIDELKFAEKIGKHGKNKNRLKNWLPKKTKLGPKQNGNKLAKKKLR